jgi:hypothetical protein
MAKADDTWLDAQADELPANVQVGADAVVAQAEAEAQAAAANVTAEDNEWQTTEHTAVADEAARDLDVATASVANANADQAAADAWEHAESQAAHDDQRAVAQSDDQSAHAQADATKAGNDTIAADKFTKDEQDAVAAQARDSQVATTHHDYVIAAALAVDQAVHTGTAQANQAVNDNVNIATVNLALDVAQRLADLQSQNSAWVTQQIANQDAMQADLLSKLPGIRDDKVTAAQVKYIADGDKPASSFTWVNPSPAESAIQIAADYMPRWQTVVAVVGLGAVAILIPGAGTALAVVGAGMLGFGLGNSASNRYFNGNQNLAQAGVGAVADVTGASTLYAGITNRDIVSGQHLGLTIAQQRQQITEGGIQFGLTVAGGVQAGRSWLRGRAPAATKPVAEQAPPTAGAKPTPPPEAPPPKATSGSNAGKAGAGEQAQVVTPCFVAGTPIRLSVGCKGIEQIKPGDFVLSRDEFDPEGLVKTKEVQEVFVRVSPVLRLVVGGREIRPTGVHPFYVPRRGWVVAGRLRPGDSVLSQAGTPLPVVVAEETGEVTTVYNFRVAEYSTYFVGADDWDFAVWVHNTNGHEASATPTSGSTDPRQTFATGSEWYEYYAQQNGGLNVEWVSGSGRTITWPS